MFILGYLAAIVMGLVLGVIGGGGSILTVPILVYLMGIDATVATGYSLLIVGTTAAFGAIRYFKDGLVDVKASIIFAIPSIIAVYLTRAYLMPAIPNEIISTPFTVSKNMAIMVLFALLMLSSAVLMLRKAYAKTEEPTPSADVATEKKQASFVFIVLEGAVVGVVTGILGAGGGFLIIPALVLFMNMPMKTAVGSSLFIIALKSLLGFTGDLQAGIELEVPLLPLMLLATCLGMAISTKIAGKLDGTALQKIFAVFTLVIACFIITKELI
ncbi:sulfite exporter TauE/SafE family protein [Glaciecola sp. XM2]|uniref:sulfite exporter TauE/SafE family protein n=1 Tax=Glaciecola sp. XM2 TaxID=1914931 RepID=UPI001BDDE95A|nr:sulfite exporter TauE/SafE family protein [Glaciecola sp. XM2]MBT1450761.1 sulfite exporter TauE/SafE family protein [Glaciecola sp. XM2]